MAFEDPRESMGPSAPEYEIGTVGFARLFLDRRVFEAVLGAHRLQHSRPPPSQRAHRPVSLTTRDHGSMAKQRLTFFITTTLSWLSLPACTLRRFGAPRR